jgi:membrane protein
VFDITLSWSELLRRTWKDSRADDVAGLAAQLSYYFFLALFPALLFLLSLASFFSLSTLTDDIGRALGPFVSPQILDLMQEQMRRMANDEHGGLLTVGAIVGGKIRRPRGGAASQLARAPREAAMQTSAAGAHAKVTLES